MSTKNSRKYSLSIHKHSKSPTSITKKANTTISSRLNTSNSGKSTQTNKYLQKKLKDPDSTPHDFHIPTHLDVIDRLRKIRNLSQIIPFSPEIPPAETPYSKQSFSLSLRIKKRKSKVEYPLPDDHSMDKFLKRIKETERIIRQEQGFMTKIRNLKPMIQLVKTTKNTAKIKLKNQKKSRTSTPTKILRSGIQAKICYNY